MAAGNDAHGAVGDAVRIDGDAGLHVGGGGLAIGGARAAEADVLVPAELGGGARRLPVHLVDDLLQGGADQRRHDLQHAAIEPDAVERRIHIGRPLHQADDAAMGRVLGDAIEQVAVAIALRVLAPLGMEPVEGAGHLRDLGRRERAAHDGIAVAPVLRHVLASQG